MVGTVGINDQLDAVASVAVGVLKVGAGVPLVGSVVLGVGDDGLDRDGVGGRTLQQDEGDGAARVGSGGIPLDVVALASGDDLSVRVSWRPFLQRHNTTSTRQNSTQGKRETYIMETRKADSIGSGAGIGADEGGKASREEGEEGEVVGSNHFDGGEGVLVGGRICVM